MINQYYYDPDRDDEYISDFLSECAAVEAYRHVNDSDDLAAWRTMWYPSCRVCLHETYCYASHQMQAAPPKREVTHD